MMNLYEILVPTIFNDTKGPVSTRHHKSWDMYVRNISGGLTILKPAKGQWIHKGQLFEERVIPVRIACTPNQIRRIAEFTKNHYRQIAVMFYKISTEVVIWPEQ